MNQERTPAAKAFSVLKKNLNYYDMKELVELIEAYLEEESQRLMVEES